MYKYKGYCATFSRDLENDLFLPGSFSFSSKIPILKEHSCKIGNVINFIEDNNGLLVEFETKYPIRESYLSLGFILIKKENFWYRNFKKVEILEVSVVSKPAQHNTRFYKKV